MKGLLLTFVILNVALRSLAYYPTNRTATGAGPIGWYPGVLGGIPSRTTIGQDLTSTVTDTTGGTDYTAAIQSAINACTAGQVVLLPPGTIAVGTLTLSSAITLRGAGRYYTNAPAGTWTMLKVGGVINLATAASSSAGRQTNAIASGATYGSSNIVLATTTADTVAGHYMWISQVNDLSLVQTNGWQGGPEVETLPFPTYICGADGSRMMGQWVKIMAASGANLTLWPPCATDWTNSPVAFINNTLLQPGMGLENMGLTNSGRAANWTVLVTDACDSWITNCSFWGSPGGEVINVMIERSARITVTHNDLFGLPSNPTADGIYCHAYTSDCLVENNALDWMQTALINAGPNCGNVFAGNFVGTNGILNGLANWQPLDLELNHLVHPFKALGEGNILGKMYADQEHGSGSHFTLFRNLARMQGRTNENQGCFGAAFESTNRFCSVVGNIFGYSGMTNVGNANSNFVYFISSPTNYLSGADYGVWAGYSLTYSGNYDGITVSTLSNHANYFWPDQTIHYDANIADHTLPDSLVYAAKPAYMGILAWPLDPANPNAATNAAAYRYYYGIDPPGTYPAHAAIRTN